MKRRPSSTTPSICISTSRCLRLPSSSCYSTANAINTVNTANTANTTRSSTRSSRIIRHQMSLLLLISSSYFHSTTLTVEAFTTSFSSSRLAATLKPTSFISSPHVTPPLSSSLFSSMSPSTSTITTKKRPKRNFDKTRQATLFKIFAKQKEIQDRLVSLNLLPVPIGNSNSNNNNNNNEIYYGDSEASLLERQAKALRISKTSLSNLLTKGLKAREELLLSNMGLVHSTVNKILYKRSELLSKVKSSINQEDLIQEGMIGLTYAIDKFDLSRNVSFSTYAMYWIEGRIMRYIKMKSTFIHVPEYMQNIVFKVQRKVYELDLLEGNGANAATGGDTFAKIESIILQDKTKMNLLCMELGLDSSTIKKAFKVRRTMYNTKSNSIVELEDWMTSNTDVIGDISSSSLVSTSMSSRSDLQTEPFSVDVEGQMEEQVLKRYQNILGQFISMREMEALSWRYGLQQQEENEQIDQGLTVTKRDYLAEAEIDIFGPGGILSTPSNTIQKIRSKPSAPTTVTSINTSAFAKTLKETRVSVKPNKGGRWGEAMSFSEVGEQMRVSAEYGRRLCSSALKKLTKAAEEGHLDPAMLF